MAKVVHQVELVLRAGRRERELVGKAVRERIGERRLLAVVAVQHPLEIVVLCAGQAAGAY